jgi:hypothetical protein
MTITSSNRSAAEVRQAGRYQTRVIRIKSGQRGFILTGIFLLQGGTDDHSVSKHGVSYQGRDTKQNPELLTITHDSNETGTLQIPVAGSPGPYRPERVEASRFPRLCSHHNRMVLPVSGSPCQRNCRYGRGRVCLRRQR